MRAFLPDEATLAGKRGESRPKRRWTPWLLIRYSLSDFGLRPIPLNEPFWESPDIWIESSDPNGNAVVGEDNFVHARIWNLGMALAAPVQVDFYWANPALGLSPASWNKIKRPDGKYKPEWVEVKSRTSADVRHSIPWVPIMLNQGHECLMVSCTNYVRDPIIYPFQPQIERHVGQRNVTVVNASAGESIHFPLDISNLFPVAARIAVLARVEHVHVASTAAEILSRRDMINHVLAYGALRESTREEIARRYRSHTAEYQVAVRLAKRAWGGQQPESGFVRGVDGSRGTARMSAKFTGESSFSRPAKPGEFMGNLLLAVDKLDSAAQCLNLARQAFLEETMFKPFEHRKLTLELGIPSDAEPGEYLAFHLTQTTEAVVAGGYTIVVHVTESKTRA